MSNANDTLRLANRWFFALYVRTLEGLEYEEYFQLPDEERNYALLGKLGELGSSPIAKRVAKRKL